MVHGPHGAIIFSDLIGKLDVLNVACEKCGRAGRYPLRRLIDDRGRDAKVIDWLDELTADCPKDIARNTNNHAVRAVAHWLYQNVPSITTCRRLVVKARI